MSVRIDKFDADEERWDSYIKRFELFFACSQINESKKVFTFLTVVGDRTFKILQDLCKPKAPSSKSYDQLVNIMQNHLHSKLSIIVERYKFNQRRQKKNETIAEYIDSIKEMSTNCEFGDYLHDHLRDRLISGTNNKRIRQRLLSNHSLTFDKAVSIIFSMEAAKGNMMCSTVSGKGRATFQNIAQKLKSITETFFCNNTAHSSSQIQPANVAKDSGKFQMNKESQNFHVPMLSSEKSENNNTAQSSSQLINVVKYSHPSQMHKLISATKKNTAKQSSRQRRVLPVNGTKKNKTNSIFHKNLISMRTAAKSKWINRAQSSNQPLNIPTPTCKKVTNKPKLTTETQSSSQIRRTNAVNGTDYTLPNIPAPQNSQKSQSTIKIFKPSKSNTIQFSSQSQSENTTIGIIKCTCCGQMGHLHTDCRFNGCQCPICGLTNHVPPMCPLWLEKVD